MHGQDVIRRDSITAMVHAYNESRREAEQAFALLNSAKQRMLQTFGQYRDSVFPERFSEYDLPRVDKAGAEIMKRNVWKSICDKLQLNELVSVKKREELDKQLSDGELPEVTEENIKAWLDQLSGDMGGLLRDSAQEVFDWLRPRRDSNWKQLKTNTKNIWGLKDKIIIEGGMDSTYDKSWPEHLSHYRDKYYRALDNVFHLLDGKGVAKYPNDICTVVNTAARDGRTSGRHEAETTYFTFRWFKNCNLHIVFKRPDLVAKLNKMAGSGALREAA
jgi:hypothetical protein